MARATTAAPTIFTAKKIENINYIDGGVSINNPCFRSTIYAKKHLNYDIDNTIVLSLGTGMFNVEMEIDKGKLYWLQKVGDAFTLSQ